MPIKLQKVHIDWTKPLQGLTWYIMGSPKTGKTTQMSNWSSKGQDGVVILDTDLGADYVEGANIIPITSLNPPIRQVIHESVPVTEMFNGSTVPKMELVPPAERGFFARTNKNEPMEVYSLVEAIEDLKINWDSKEYKNIDTVVIDTIDKVNLWMEVIIEQKLGVDNIADAGFGAGWATVSSKIDKSIQSLQEFLKRRGGTLVLISHCKPSTMIDGKVQLSPNIPKGLAAKLTRRSDIIGVTGIQQGTGAFMISFMGYGERQVGSRLRPLVGKQLPFNYIEIMNELKTYSKENENASTK